MTKLTMTRSEKVRVMEIAIGIMSIVILLLISNRTNHNNGIEEQPEALGVAIEEVVVDTTVSGETKPEEQIDDNVKIIEKSEVKGEIISSKGETPVTSTVEPAVETPVVEETPVIAAPVEEVPVVEAAPAVEEIPAETEVIEAPVYVTEISGPGYAEPTEEPTSDAEKYECLEVGETLPAGTVIENNKITYPDGSYREVSITSQEEVERDGMKFVITKYDNGMSEIKPLS